MEGYVELMKLKGEDVSALDQSAIEYEVDQVLDAVDFDKNGFIEYSGPLKIDSEIETEIEIETETEIETQPER